MSHTFRRASLLLLTVMTFVFVSMMGCTKGLKGQPQATKVGADIPPVTNLIQNAVRSDRLRGAVLLLLKNNQVIYQKAFGDYSVNTVVPIASASKWISASVIMTLVDEGRIGLDEPISKYLPNFTGEKSTITLRQLLSHTSGLPSEHRCLSDSSTTLAECVEQISQVRLRAAPGTQFRYGGVSFQVAGRVAEVVSGKSWNTLFEEKIKAPLNMVNTSYGNTENPRIAGGASSTVQDYANLLQMHLNKGQFNGKQVLSTTAIDEMERDQTSEIPVAYTPMPDTRHYGLGEWLDSVGRNGKAVQLSSQGAFGFSPWMDRQRNLIGVFLVNNRLRNVYSLVQDMQQAVDQKVDEQVR